MTKRFIFGGVPLFALLAVGILLFSNTPDETPESAGQVTPNTIAATTNQPSTTTNVLGATTATTDTTAARTNNPNSVIIRQSRPHSTPVAASTNIIPFAPAPQKDIETKLPEECDPNYVPCVPVSSAGIDCSNIGTPITIKGIDIYELDADNNGTACEEYANYPDDEGELLSPIPTITPTGGYPYANYRKSSWNHLMSSTYEDGIDPWGMYYRQSVSYAAWKVAASTGTLLVGYGDAKNWPSRALAAGKIVDNNAAVGAIAIRQAGTFGHAMYVESVLENDMIKVSHYNASLTGIYSEETIPTTDLKFIHF